MRGRQVSVFKQMQLAAPTTRAQMTTSRITAHKGMETKWSSRLTRRSWRDTRSPSSIAIPLPPSRINQRLRQTWQRTLHRLPRNQRRITKCSSHGKKPIWRRKRGRPCIRGLALISISIRIWSCTMRWRSWRRTGWTSCWMTTNQSRVRAQGAIFSKRVSQRKRYQPRRGINRMTLQSCRIRIPREA